MCVARSVRILVPMGLSEGRSAFSVPRTYTEAIRHEGAVPFMVSGPFSEEEADRALDLVDGLLLTGGGDLAPRYLGETPHPRLGTVEPERDVLEWSLLGHAIDRGLPVLGICRGSQMLAARVGGRIWQDIESQAPGAMQHVQKAPRGHESHSVRLAPGTLGARVFEDRPELWVNSFHHQAVRSLPEGWRVFATAPDGVIEGFEREGDGFALGIQWHPEGLVDEDPVQRLPFRAFVAAAARRTAAAR
jgi:putative glutamine amidotransferase